MKNANLMISMVNSTQSKEFCVSTLNLQTSTPINSAVRQNETSVHKSDILSRSVSRMDLNVSKHRQVVLRETNENLKTISVKTFTRKEFDTLWNKKDSKPLGEGSFGTVYGAKDSNEKEYVIKVFKSNAKQKDIDDEVAGNNALFEGTAKFDDQMFYQQGVIMYHIKKH